MGLKQTKHKSCLAKQTLQGRRDERNSQVKVYMAD